MKRLSLILFLAALMVVITGCTNNNESKQGDAANATLTVFDWSGFESQNLWGSFAKAHPETNVTHSFFTEDGEAFAKLQTGYETDLVHPCSGWFLSYVENNLVQPIDTSKLTNFAKLSPELVEQGKINGKQYFIPWDWGYESIIVRTDKVKTIPTSWADLWNPEYKGKVAIFDSAETQHIVGALALGFDPYNTTPEQNEAITQKLIELKPNLLTYWSDFSEIAQLISSGDVWIAANTWPDSYKLLLKEKVPVDYITPKEGRMGYVCAYGISAKSPRPDLALAYLDSMISTEGMVNMINEFGYGAANLEAATQADPETVNLLQLDNSELLKQSIFYHPLSAAQRDVVTKSWDQVKSAP